MTKAVKATKNMVKTTDKTIKKKRPWRNKVRRDAKNQKKREARDNGELKEDVHVPSIPVEESSTKKKKKRSKKKKFVEPEVKEEEPLTVIEEKKKILDAGRFRYLNEQLYTMSGSDAFKYFDEDKEAFFCYHKGFADQVKKWPNHPLATITQWLKNQPNNKVVLDLGCGEAKIAESVGNIHKIHSFDLVAVNERVTACDMAHLPLEAESADIAIFCLSLMGTNTVDFLKEARRVLKLGGILKIAEVTSRFVNIKLFCEAVVKMGFELLEKKPLTDYFVMLQFKKSDKVEHKRPFGLKLKPCLYKKR